jgi:cytochrome P450
MWDFLLEGVPMIVTDAKFRLATPEEVQEAKGDCLGRVFSAPWKLLNKSWGTCNLIWSSTNSLLWDTPVPLKIAHWWTQRPHHSFLIELTSFLFDGFMITDKKVSEAFFSIHRNGADQIFTPNRSLARIYEMVKQTFPETNFELEDTIFTCSDENSKLYRKMFSTATHGEHVAIAIQEEVKAAVERWTKECSGGNYINITTETRRLASNIITRTLLGQKVDNTKLCDSVNYINVYIYKEFLKSATAADKEAFKEALKVFREETNKILDCEDVPLLGDKILTQAQKQALVFVTFFAGQETVASLINSTLYDIARDSEMAKRLETDTEKDIFVRSIHDFTPAYGVGRKLKSDVCLEYTFEGEEEPRKVILFKDMLLGARIYSMAEATMLPDEGSLPHDLNWMPFGAGTHVCPGKGLAENEFKTLFAELKNGYKITLKPDMEEPARVGLITLQLNKDVFINIKKKDE